MHRPRQIKNCTALPCVHPQYHSLLGWEIKWHLPDLAVAKLIQAPVKASSLTLSSPN